MSGIKISQLRKNRGMSQELLAETAGISLRTIQRIESDATQHHPHTLKAIANALQISIDELEEKRAEANSLPTDSLKLLNLVALVVIVLPVIHIVMMLLAWRKAYRPNLAPLAAKIISFQILWTIITLVLTISVPFVQHALVQSYVIGHLPPTVIIVYATLLLINIVFIIQTAWRLQSGTTNVFTFIPALF